MRFQKFINEETDFDTIEKVLEQECSQIIEEYRKCGRILYRGTKKSIKDWKFITPRKNREPKDTPKEMHKILDDAFQKRFGWKARSEGVFALSDSMYVSEYGREYFFFPKDGYKYIWHPQIQDLYVGDNMERSQFPLYYVKIYHGLLSKTNPTSAIWRREFKEFKKDKGEKPEIYKDFPDNITYRDFLERVKEMKKEKLKEILPDIIKGYRTDDMCSAMALRYEIMFKCDGYYLVDMSYQYEIAKRFGLRIL